MPSASVGLLRFFEEEIPGISVKPKLVLVFAAALIAICIVAYLYF